MSSSFNHTSVPNSRNQPRGRWFTNITKAQNSNRITGGPGILVTQDGSGVTISVDPKPQPSAGKTIYGNMNGYPCKVISGNSMTGYNVDVYVDGIHKPKTSTGLLRPLEVAGVSSLAHGSWIMGFPGTSLITGGTE